MAPLELIPIKPTLKENEEFLLHADCMTILPMTLDYYKVVGYRPPWISYFVRKEGKYVGGAGFKGQPINNKIEIAYGTFPDCQHQGIATEMCQELVLLALKTNPQVLITARTFAEHNYSTRVLQHNSFDCLGIVWDQDDGEVWEWVYRKK